MADVPPRGQDPRGNQSRVVPPSTMVELLLAVSAPKAGMVTIDIQKFRRADRPRQVSVRREPSAVEPWTRLLLTR